GPKGPEADKLHTLILSEGGGRRNGSAKSGDEPSDFDNHLAVEMRLLLTPVTPRLVSATSVGQRPYATARARQARGRRRGGRYPGIRASSRDSRQCRGATRPRHNLPISVWRRPAFRHPSRSTRRPA